MKAVEDDAGGSNVALAQAIANDHPEACDSIVKNDRKQHQCYSSDQHVSMRPREPTPLTYTGPLATANYHKIARLLEKSSSKVEDLQKVTKAITNSDVLSDDVKVVALCWESLTDIPVKRKEKGLQIAWEKASKLECKNGVLLQGRVQIHLALFQCSLKNFEKATGYIELAKQRFVFAAHSIDTASLLYTEMLIAWRRLSSAPVSVVFSQLHKSNEHKYDSLLKHVEYMEEYEKYRIFLFFTEKAKLHLRSVLITDKLPPEEYWPSQEDLKKADLCLHQTVVSKDRYEMPEKSNFEGNYYLTLSDLHLWKGQYRKAMEYAVLAKQHFIHGPWVSLYIDRAEKRLKLIQEKQQEEEECNKLKSLVNIT